jgi:hypothetical protein
MKLHLHEYREIALRLVNKETAGIFSVYVTEYNILSNVNSKKHRVRSQEHSWLLNSI